MSRILLLILGAAVFFSTLAAGSGCAVGHYWMDRGNDFADMFGLRVCGNLGGGLEANVRVTEFIQTGFGWSEKYVVGTSGREFGAYLEQSYSLFFIPSDWVPWIYPTPFGFKRGIKRTAISGNFPPIDVDRQVSIIPSYGKKYSVLWDVGFTKRDKKTRYDRRWDDIGFSVCAGFPVVVGIEFEIRLREVIDFIFGWFVAPDLILMKDDKLPRYLRGELDKPEEPPPEP